MSRRGRGAQDGPPLYAQIHHALVARISTGHWRPGQQLPSEFELADEFGVHQGTMRRALEELEREKLIERKQGRGSFVVEHTPAHVHFRFFTIYGPNGERVIPDSTDAHVRQRASRAIEREKLQLADAARVIEIRRIRTSRDRPFVSETIILPATRFPGLAARDPIPNTLYDLFQAEYGVTIARIEERLSAIAASRDVASALALAVRAPLMQIDRIAFDLAGKPVEWRVSDCALGGGYYLARLG